MVEAHSTTGPASRPMPFAPLRIWHLAALVLYAAVAIANIQDQRRHEPVLIGLACGGFLAYGVIGWWIWRSARRFRRHLGALPSLILYLFAMAVFIWVATVVYVVLESTYLGVSLWP